MKILITGGAGFIGSHLCDELLKKGNDVIIIDDLSTGRMENIEHLKNNPKFHFAIETIMNETVMDRLVSECDAIFHLAAAVGVELIVHNPVEVIERNILGSECVLKIANRYKKRVFLASTSEIYGKNEKIPFKEDDDRLLGPTTKSRWSYSSSKAIDEFLGLAYWKEKHLPVIIGRFFNTIGPRQTGQYGMVVPRFVKQALLGKDITVFGDGNQSRCFTYVSDVVQSIIVLLDHPDAIGEIFNIGGGKEIKINELAERVISITNSPSRIVHIPYDKAYESGFEDMKRRVPDIKKIKKLIGYSPKVDLDEMLKRVADDLLKNDNDLKSLSQK
jgi:UDP-glucose 4-epimerase